LNLPTAAAINGYVIGLLFPHWLTDLKICNQKWHSWCNSVRFTE